MGKNVYVSEGQLGEKETQCVYFMSDRLLK